MSVAKPGTKANPTTSIRGRAIVHSVSTDGDGTSLRAELELTGEWVWRTRGKKRLDVVGTEFDITLRAPATLPKGRRR